ncbi:TatD family hydrolase [Aestuariibacter sp. AA17]|uniref:TatD family hydrolase n=1 Tax=Fluctibacter corallii TaxID=2984329 RepID=A0ABT3A3J9_9ALTE|nr:TatD family hydrolase [Aestuariibacter sp. AA17]MCV2883241.1 TatD family hydrolase [Aestuariibacter sp. AA17]
MIDSHCHFDFSDFDSDRDTLLTQCKARHISHILIPGVAPEYWPRQVRLSQQHSELLYTVGIHPHFIADCWQEQLAQLKTWVNSQQGFIGIGEIGLDFALPLARDIQLAVFESQVEIAQQANLPLIIHHRRSHNEIIRVLKQYQLPRGGVVHAFSGSTHEAKTYTDMGFYLGVGGTITYQRAAKTRAAIQATSLDWLLLETDAPDMPLFGHQGHRNDPTQLVDIAEALATLKGETASSIAKATTSNFAVLFDVDDVLDVS